MALIVNQWQSSYKCKSTNSKWSSRFSWQSMWQLVNVGFYIGSSYSFLGTSPDGSVYDPCDSHQPLGFLEIKCP